jgi:hypothetical protein
MTYVSTEVGGRYVGTRRTASRIDQPQPFAAVRPARSRLPEWPGRSADRTGQVQPEARATPFPVRATGRHTVTVTVGRG